ncbi:MAG: sulfatase [Armatimonadota bacterium]|nr:sulfatase [Armatimonadota bacterium]
MTMNGMTRRDFIRKAGLAAAALALPTDLLADAARADRPNFVFILADDLGWADLNCYGNTFHETPNIDRLAAEGVRFTNAYAACPVCSPTRASIMTGRYPARIGLTDWIPGHRIKDAKLVTPDVLKYLPHDEITIAEALKSAGYATGSVGKWHMGGDGYLPQDQGFDINIGGSNAGSPPGGYYLPNKMNLKDMKPGEYLTDRLASEGAKFIEANKSRPFFLYQAFHSVHIPIQAKKEYQEKYRAKPSGDRKYNAAYAGMVQSLDEGVGRILRTLKDLDLDKRTVVFFVSDNGGFLQYTRNDPLREGKGYLYEGGIRDPMIVRYPPLVKAGRVRETPVSSVDFFPTILEMAGARTPKRQIDGISIVSLLRGKDALPRRALYWHYPHYNSQGGTPASAIRYGDYKLLHFYEDNHVELYNLRDDISEQHDLSAKAPQTVAKLRGLLSDWLNDVGAKLPTPIGPR